MTTNSMRISLPLVNFAFPNELKKKIFDFDRNWKYFFTTNQVVSLKKLNLIYANRIFWEKSSNDFTIPFYGFGWMLQEY